MRPLVLVHGFMGGSAQWQAQAPLSEDRDVIAVDLPGFGKHADLQPVSSTAEFADWVLNDLTVRGVTEFDLLGHSMGGMIVQEMVSAAPDRVGKLILYATGAVGVLPGRFEPISVSMDRARTDGAVATSRRISATWFLKGAEDPAYAACAEIAALTRLPAMLAGLGAMENWVGTDRLSAIPVPTLVIWGDRDRTYGWPQIERLWQGIPDASLAVVPNTAHAVHAEEPEFFNHLVTRFLST